MSIEDKTLGLLIVEDDEGVRRSLLRWAQLRDLRVVGCPSAEQCIQGMRDGEFSLIDREHPKFLSHALIDMTLPGRDGLSLVAELSPPLPINNVILITARVGESPTGHESLYRKCVVLSKPFDLSALEALLRLDLD